MSLICLLIALAAERYLSSPYWQFNFYYRHYLSLFSQILSKDKLTNDYLGNIALIAIPTVACYFLLSLLDDGLLHFLVSTVILISCFGCVKTRDTYKQYLMSAFRGEQTTCELHHQQLAQDKNMPEMGFGQLLIWLNYRYFIAIMLFFVLFGATGALLYRLVSKLNEANQEANTTIEGSPENLDNNIEEQLTEAEQGPDTDIQLDEPNEEVTSFNSQLLFWLDWLPVRVVAFGYMLVGHFSRALPIWLESLFDVGKLPHKVLIDVAQKSEDFMIDQDDCTAEPCLLVRLAKRTLLLCLAVLAILILTGVLT